MRVWRRAGCDWWKWLKDHVLVSTAVLFGGSAVGIGIDVFVRGWNAAMDQLAVLLIYVVAAPAILLLLLYLVFLTATPHRLLKERVMALEEQGEQDSRNERRAKRSPEEQFHRMVSWMGSQLHRLRTDWEHLERENRQQELRRGTRWAPDEDLSPEDRNEYLDSLARFRGDVARLGIEVLALPQVYADVGRWVSYLERLLEYATRSDLEGARKWSREFSRGVECS